MARSAHPASARLAALTTRAPATPRRHPGVPRLFSACGRARPILGSSSAVASAALSATAAAAANAAPRPLTLGRGRGSASPARGQHVDHGLVADLGLADLLNAAECRGDTVGDDRAASGLAVSPMADAEARRPSPHSAPEVPPARSDQASRAAVSTVPAPAPAASAALGRGRRRRGRRAACRCRGRRRRRPRRSRPSSSAFSSIVSRIAASASTTAWPRHGMLRRPARRAARPAPVRGCRLDFIGAVSLRRRSVALAVGRRSRPVRPRASRVRRRARTGSARSRPCRSW